MQYLHTMLRVTRLDQALCFFCDKLGMAEVKRTEHEAGRFTLVFLAAPDDIAAAQADTAPLLELTYNWPAQNGMVRTYTTGRNFGHLAYRVNNIYETCQRLMALNTVINRPPRDGRMAFIKSPDGVSIELLQKGEPLAIQEPWASMPNTGEW